MRRVGDQPVPIIVTDLVAEMTEQRAIRLAHLMTAALALHIVGFRQIDRDDAVGVAGHYRRTGGRDVGQKFERQTEGLSAGVLTGRRNENRV